MLDTIAQTFSIEYFMPHGHCYLWNPALLWSMVISNSIIALAYYSIPIALMVTVKQRGNDTLKWIFIMFSAFIFACGTTHVISIAVIWYPNYWLDAGAKVITAIISAIAAIALWPIVGRAKAHIAVQARNTEELKGSNVQLKESISALERQRSDFQTLNKMGGFLHVCNNISEISKTMIETVTSLWPDSSGALYLIEPSETEFSLSGSWGNATQCEQINAPSCWAYRLARPFPDKEVQINHVCEPSKCGLAKLKICLPIIAGGETLGLLHLQGLKLPLDSRADSILQLLIERSGLAIYNMRLKLSLEFKSTRDSLTELFNRRYLDEALEIEVKRASRNNGQLSIIMFDLDNFKLLNDTHGHDAGDHALRLFSSVLKSNLRSGDVACRYGGEEFILLLPGTNLENAEDLANRVRTGLEVCTSKNVSESFLTGLTASAGVAELSQNCKSAEDLIHRADQALYQAKESGRNIVLVAK